MGSRWSILAGLLGGVLVAVLLIAAIVVFVPDPVPVTTSPPPAEPSGSPSQPPEPTPSPSDAGAASPTPPSGPIVTGFHIGEAAPALVVPQVGGGSIDLAALEGKPVWVNFMGTYCPPCREEFPVMNGFAARYAEEGLVVLAIDVREDEGTVAAFAQSLNVTFPLGLDEDGSAQEAWDAHFLPVHFFVDAEGIVRDGALGGVAHDVFARGLARIMPGVEVTP